MYNCHQSRLNQGMYAKVKQDHNALGEQEFKTSSKLPLQINHGVWLLEKATCLFIQIIKLANWVLLPTMTSRVKVG